MGVANRSSGKSGKETGGGTVVREGRAGGMGKRVFRCRNITSCKRCFESKRKCSKTRPSCDRCVRMKSECVYFTEDQLENRKESRRQQKVADAQDVHDVPNREITPQPRARENHNFKLIVNSTGEYSKYFPMSLFPFYEHSSNVSLVVDSKKNAQQTVAVFDFNVMFKHLASLAEIKSHIPTQIVCDHFINHFFSNVFPIIPIVDREEFEFKYQTFRKDPAGFEDLNALMLLFAILFCSATSMLINQALEVVSTPHVDYQLMRVDFFNSIENLRYMLNTNVTPSLSSLTSLTLIYYVGSVNGFPVTVQISMLAKLSQVFGLHRKITHKLDTTPLRDLVYCFIWFLDATSTYYTGLSTNMPPRSFESESMFPTKSNDVLSLFLLARLYNAKVWTSILDKINQIEPCTIEEYQLLDDLFYKSVSTVNAITQNILTSQEAESPAYLKWLATESRMGLSKSFVLLSVLRHSLNYVPNENLINKLTTDLVLQSLVLINESMLKLLIGRVALPSCMWYNRLCFPFQAMYVVLSHIKQYPTHELNLSQLEQKFEFTQDPLLGLDVCKGDIRMPIVDRCIDVLSILEPVWTPVTNDRFHRIKKFRTYVGEQLAKNPHPSNKQSPASPVAAMGSQRGSHAGEAFSTAGIHAGSIYGATPDLSAYTFLDDGLQFMFGEDFVNRRINAIVSDMDVFYNSLG